MKEVPLLEPKPEPGHAKPELPDRKSLASYRETAAHCRACALWENATQTVFGEGKRTAKVVLVGEQPGDREDIAGRPFVGPAGRVLDDALEAAGIDRNEVYVTNVVKHFKWRRAGKRRLHEKPGRSEIQACRLWLDAELAILKPPDPRLPRRDGGAGVDRADLQGDQGARQADRFAARS